MSLLDDPSQVLHRLIAPELRELNERIDTLERQFIEHEQRAERRHAELLFAIQQLSAPRPQPQDLLARRRVSGILME